MSFYQLLKIIHISTVILSLTFFLTRAYWLIQQPELLKNRIVRKLPHLIDSILLFSALALVYTGNLIPLRENPWITAKIIALICYILAGLYLFRIANTPRQQYISLFIAFLIYLYIIQTAISKNTVPYLY